VTVITCETFRLGKSWLVMFETYTVAKCDSVIINCIKYFVAVQVAQLLLTDIA